MTNLAKCAVVFVLFALAPVSASAQTIYVGGGVGVGQQPVYQQQPVYTGGCTRHHQCPTDHRCIQGACRAPSGYENAPNWGLIVPGIIVLGVGYVLNALVSAFVVEVGDAFGSVGYEPFYFGFIPVAGPWIELGFYAYDDGLSGYFIVDGIAQAVGLTLIIIGAAVGHTVPYWALGEDGPTLAVLPTIGRDGSGLSATLTF